MHETIPDAVIRLAAARRDQPAFLLPHHVEAARRLALTFEKARLRQRVTMSYDPARVGGRSGGKAFEASLGTSPSPGRSRAQPLS